MCKHILQNKKILITAGPTKEAIDPVRFISNHSSGKMGYAIAESFLQQGAEVILISGPVCIQLEHRRLTILHVNSALEMYMACCRHFETVDIAVFCAAVADYRPQIIAREKIKKQDDTFTIKMVKNVDIAAEFGKVKTTVQLSVGFALETNNEQEHALDKLHRKNFDMIILNSMRDANAGFGFDTNKIDIIRRNGFRRALPLQSKTKVAEEIVQDTALLWQQYIQEEPVYQ